MDSRLGLNIVIYSAINIASIFKININSILIVGILFSNGVEVNEVRWYRELSIATFWVAVNSLKTAVEVAATTIKAFVISIMIYDMLIYL